MDFSKIPTNPGTLEFEQLDRYLASIADSIGEQVGDHHLIYFSRKNGLPAMSFITKGNGKALFTISRQKDDTISTPKGNEPHALMGLAKADTRAFTRQLEHKLGARALKDPPTRRALMAMTARGAHSSVQSLMSEYAQLIGQRLLSHSLMPSGTRPVPVNTSQGTWNRLVRTHFTEPGVLKLAETLGLSPEFNLTAPQYNFLLQNQGVITRRIKDRTFKTQVAKLTLEATHLQQGITLLETDNLTETMSKNRSVNRAPPKRTAREQEEEGHALLIQEHLETDACQAVDAAMPRWSNFRASTERGRTILRVLVDTKGKAANTIIVHPDGTLETHYPHAPYEDRIALHSSQLEQLLHHHLAFLLLEHTRRALPRSMASVITNHTVMVSLISIANQLARDIACRHILENMPGTNFTQMTKLVNNKVRDGLDGRTIQLANQLFNPITETEHNRLPKTHQYNLVALNQQLFEAMISTGQTTPLRYHCIHLCKEGPPRKFEHPGEIIRETRAAVAMTDAQWRYFCLAAKVERHDIPGSQFMAGMRNSCQVLAEANRPKAPHHLLRMVFIRPREHDAFRNAEWDHGSAWDAWVNIVRRFLEPQPQPVSPSQLSRVTDAFHYHVTNQLPWGPGNWQALRARTSRWHREVPRHSRTN